jgi:peptide/nickel transport system substrate-binding protein
MPEQPDDVTYIIRLREGVAFHDSQRAREHFPKVAGRALTSEDVHYSIARQTNENSPAARRFFHRAAWEAIDKIETPDDRTVVIRLKRAVAPFAAFLAGRHAFVLPRDVVGTTDEIAADTALIGSGPFMLESLQTGVVVQLRRNPTWFGKKDNPDGSGQERPFLDGYDAYFSPQEDTFQRAAFERKIVDSTGFLDPDVVQREHTTNLADILLEERDAGGLLACRLLLDRAPFRDDRARRAIHLAIDRAALAELLYPPLEGRPSAKLSGPIAPAMTEWALRQDDLLSMPGYGASRADDVAQARQLWEAAAGNDALKELPVFFAGVPRTIPERAIAAVQRQLSETLGLRVMPQVDTSGHAVIASALGKNLEGATQGVTPFTFGFEDGGVELDEWLYPQFRGGGPLNSYRLQDATLDGMLDGLRTEFDADERAKKARDVQDYLLANVNARIEILAPVERRLTWGYVRNPHLPLWDGSNEALANTWLETAHPGWSGRPA